MIMCEIVSKTVDKIMQNVIKNNSVIEWRDLVDDAFNKKKNGEFTLEKGCEIKIVNHKPSLVDNTFWNKLKTKFYLDCAHIAVDNGRFSGCVYDYLRESACPHNKGKFNSPS